MLWEAAQTLKRVHKCTHAQVQNISHQVRDVVLYILRLVEVEVDFQIVSFVYRSYISSYNNNMAHLVLAKHWRDRMHSS